MQIVAAALTWQNLWLFSPKIPDNDPALLVCPSAARLAGLNVVCAAMLPRCPHTPLECG